MTKNLPAFISTTEKDNCETSLRYIKLFFEDMNKKERNLFYSYSYKHNLYNHKAFKQEFEKLFAVSANKEALMSLYQQCWQQTNNCLDMYNKLEYLPDVNKLRVNTSAPLSYLIEETPKGKFKLVDPENAYTVYDKYHVGLISRMELHIFCLEVKNILSQYLFKSIDKPPISKTFKIIGNYKQICFIFSSLYNSGAYGFKNRLQEIAVFIDRHFYFTEGEKNPSLLTILKELCILSGQEFSGFDFPKEQDIKLLWMGNKNQLYYIFKKIHIPLKKDKEDKNESLAILESGMDNLTYFIIDNFLFEGKEPSSYETLSTLLPKPIIDIIKNNIPEIDWDKIKTFK